MESLTITSILKLIENLSYEDEQKLIDIFLKKQNKNIYYISEYDEGTERYMHITARSRSEAVSKYCRSTDFFGQFQIARLNHEPEELFNLYVREFNNSSYSRCEVVDIEHDLKINDKLKNMGPVSEYNCLIIDVLSLILKCESTVKPIRGEFIWSIIRNEVPNKLDIKSFGYLDKFLLRNYPDSMPYFGNFYIKDGNNRFTISFVNSTDYFDIDDFQTDNIDELINYFTLKDYDVVDKLWKDKDISNILNKKFRIKEHNNLDVVRESDRYKKMIDLGYTEIN